MRTRVRACAERMLELDEGGCGELDFGVAIEQLGDYGEPPVIHRFNDTGDRTSR